MLLLGQFGLHIGDSFCEEELTDFVEEKMEKDIEYIDKKRIRLLELYLAGFVLFIIFSTTRYFLRDGGLNSRPIGNVVLIGAMIGVVIVAYSAFQLGMIHNKLKNDPALKEALYDELVQSIERGSWKAAYIGAISSTVFFAIVYFFYPVYDPVLVALNSIIVGAGAYQFYFYVKYKSL